MNDSNSTSSVNGAYLPGQFYKKLAIFTDHWLAHCRLTVKEPVSTYQRYRQANGMPARSFEELAFEMLYWGVLLEEYGAQAAGFPQWAAGLLEGLLARQAETPHAERAIHTLMSLVNSLGQQFKGRVRSGEIEAIAGARAAGIPLSFEGDPDVGCTHFVRRLVQWLASQGRSVEASRLEEWQAFVESFDPLGSQELIVGALMLVDDFLAESKSLGVPLSAALCLLGSELLAQASQENAAEAGRKIILVPGHFRSRPAHRLVGLQCQASQEEIGEACQACTDTCRVKQISSLAQSQGLEVNIFPSRPSSSEIQGLIKLEGAGIIWVIAPGEPWDIPWALQDAGVWLLGCLVDAPPTEELEDEEVSPSLLDNLLAPGIQRLLGLS